MSTLRKTPDYCIQHISGDYVRKVFSCQNLVISSTIFNTAVVPMSGVLHSFLYGQCAHITQATG